MPLNICDVGGGPYMDGIVVAVAAGCDARSPDEAFS
jgi:hypothetical protein